MRMMTKMTRNLRLAPKTVTKMMKMRMKMMTECSMNYPYTDKPVDHIDDGKC